MSDRYIADRFLPDKAIDLVDEAAAKLKMEITSKPVHLDEIDRKILQLEMERLSLTKVRAASLCSCSSIALFNICEWPECVWPSLRRPYMGRSYVLPLFLLCRSGWHVWHCIYHAAFHWVLCCIQYGAW